MYPNIKLLDTFEPRVTADELRAADAAAACERGRRRLVTPNPGCFNVQRRLGNPRCGYADRGFDQRSPGKRLKSASAE